MSAIEIAYSENDMYYENANYCSTDPVKGLVNRDGSNTAECVDNKSAYTNLVKTTNHNSKSLEKYENIKQMYNREIIYAFNLIIGICALVYYIYLNQDALPSVESISSAVKEAAKNTAANLATTPATATIKP